MPLRRLILVTSLMVGLGCGCAGDDLVLPDAGASILGNRDTTAGVGDGGPGTTLPTADADLGAGGAPTDAWSSIDGASVTGSESCAGSPYKQSCLDGFFAGFDASGACTVSGKGGPTLTLQWQNGARVVFSLDADGSGFEAQVYASDQSACGGLIAGGADGTEVSWLSPTDGQSYKSANRPDGQREFFCPDKTKMVMTRQAVLGGIGCLFSSTAGKCPLQSADLNNAF